MDRQKIKITTMFSFVLLSLLCASVDSEISSNRNDPNSETRLTARVRNISAEVESTIDHILTKENATFSTLTKNATYYSKTYYYAPGMDGVYNITKAFMGQVLKKKILLDEYIVYDSNGLHATDSLLSEWTRLLKHYSWLLVIVLLALLFVVIMPFVALFFCCCRCCGRCGARSQPFDKKHDMCRRVILSFMLICVGTALLFGVVCTFMTNQYMESGTRSLPDNWRVSVRDTRTYLNYTEAQLDMLLIVNFKELEESLTEILDMSGEIVQSKLEEYSHAVSVSHLANIVNDLPQVSEDLKKMKRVTNELRINASELNDGLRHVKNQLLHELTQCQNNGVRQCKEFGNMNQIGKLDTTVDFNTLPDVSEYLNNISELLLNNITEEVQKGKQTFDNIKLEIQKTVNTSIPKVKKAISEAGEAIKEKVNNFTYILRRASHDINDQNSINRADEYIQKYSIYRWYAGLAISSVLLVIVLCISCGLMCGICGKRPDGYGDDCCNKGAGSKFLMLGVAVIFLFSSALMIVCIAAMLVGMVTQRGACDPLRNPTDPDASQLWTLLDKMSALNESNGPHIQLSRAVAACHQNKSLYNVLDLQQKYDLKDLRTYLDKYGISEQIAKLKDKISMAKDITIITPEAIAKLDKLADSGLGDIAFYKFTEVLENNITSINLLNLANNLSDTANNINNQPELENIKKALNRNARFLQMYQRTLVDPMVANAYDLNETASRLEIELKFNRSSFSDAIRELQLEVVEAQVYLQNKGPEVVSQIAKEFAENLKGRVHHYLGHVATEVETNVGQCGPLSKVYNATLTATCDRILNPFNGFWFSLGCCVLLFIPTIILSVKLGTLYQKSDPYPGPLVEHEYLYDAYADRDNIPLGKRHYYYRSVHDKRNKKKTKKHGRGPAYHQESYENQAGYTSDHTGEQPIIARGPGGEVPGSSGHDMRYTDMAPKPFSYIRSPKCLSFSRRVNVNAKPNRHWEDFPNGGPPQYHNPPVATEYERPPPYYYPGPANRP